MARITAPAWVVANVNALLCWYETHNAGNPLSYPSKAVEARMQQGGRGAPGPLVPLYTLTPELASVDRAFREMPDKLRLAVLCRHLGGYKDYFAETGESRSMYYSFVDAGYWFIAGVNVHRHAEAI